MLNKPRLLTTKEVAQMYRKHEVTVRVSLQEGLLHGRQRVTGGRWLIEESCADAWSRGEKCVHAQEAARSIELRRITA